MTDERAREIAKIFDDNFAMAKKMGADNTSLALAAATVYTIDDLMHMGEIQSRQGEIQSRQIDLVRLFRGE